MSYPRWVSIVPAENLREVAPHLYIGAVRSPRLRPEGDWALVVDWYGSSRANSDLYGNALVLRVPFADGDAFPPGSLDRAYSLVRDALMHQRPVLFHCQAGLSRSASSAYAMMRVLYEMSHDEALRRVQIMAEYPRPATLRSARAWVHKKRRQ